MATDERKQSRPSSAGAGAPDAASQAMGHDVIIHGKYRLRESLGKGGMAEVFRARVEGAEGFSRYLALKRMAPELSADDRFAQLFVREAQIASMLSHPNIVTVIDFDRDESGRLFLVSELVEGCDVSRLLRRARECGKQFPYQLAVFVAAEVLRALAHAHAQCDQGQPLKIVHRDVTPQNVFVSRVGAVKLGDFGIAKATAGARSTVGGKIKGKVAYMSPEQASGHPIDARTDVYAVGVMLYEMLTGKRPYRGTQNEVLAQLLVAKPAAVDALDESIPADLAEMTMCMFARNPDERYPSAQHALESLLACSCWPDDGKTELANYVTALFAPREASRAHLQPRTTRGSSRTPPSQVGKPGRSRLWIGVGALLGAALGAGVVYFAGLYELPQTGEPVALAKTVQPDGPIAEGRAALALEELASARRAFMKARKQSQWRLEACIGLTEVELRAKDFDAALHFAKLANKYAPRQASVKTLLGRVYFARADYERARQHFDEALVLRPQDSEASVLSRRAREALTAKD